MSKTIAIAALVLVGSAALVGLGAVLMGIILKMRSSRQRRQANPGGDRIYAGSLANPRHLSRGVTKSLELGDMAERDVPGIPVKMPKPPPVRPGVIARLMVESGLHRGQVIDISRSPFIMGRSNSSDLQVLDAAVSRFHARLSHVNGDFLLEDTHSSNGTYLNNMLVERSTVVHGDKIQIGRTLMVFLDHTR
jgi:pSer/pThr/pTyr-binding forkhead associated (FHA) protein